MPTSPSTHVPSSFPAASPSRLRSNSPRQLSPASTEIFERNVQEPVPISTFAGELSPAHIPSHVMTEDRIPPALEASAQAITSDVLDADDVEILTTTSHQSVATADASQLHSPASPPPPSLQHVRSTDSERPPSIAFLPDGALEEGDRASSYGQLDPTDVRRLSFISFADVVQSEHQLASPPTGEPADGLHMTSSFHSGERRGSAQHSPRHGVFGTPPSGSGKLVNPRGESEVSPVRSSASVGVSYGDLTVETMRQAVRKTASGELPRAGTRGLGMSPIVSDEWSAMPRNRTDT